MTRLVKRYARFMRQSVMIKNNFETRYFYEFIAGGRHLVNQQIGSARKLASMLTGLRF
jgi:hypothetical protein